MSVQSVEPLGEELSAQSSIPDSWLWTWAGVCFGYRREEWLFTADGVGVGRFVGDEVYAANGEYLGELIKSGQGHRLVSSSYKKSRVKAGFSPRLHGAYPRPANRFELPMYCGYEDFPSPETLKAGVRKTSDLGFTVSSFFEAKREAAPSPDRNSHTNAPAAAISDRQVSRAESVVVIDANAFTHCLGSSEPHNDIYGAPNASIESNPTLPSPNLTPPANAVGETEDETATPSQADPRAEHLRQLVLNINRRASERRMRSSAATLIKVAGTDQIHGSVDRGLFVSDSQVTLISGRDIEPLNDQPFETPEFQISVLTNFEAAAVPNHSEPHIERQSPRFRTMLVLLAASLVNLALILFDVYPFQKTNMTRQDSSGQKSLTQPADVVEEVPSSAKAISSSGTVANGVLINHAEVKATEPSWISAIVDGRSFPGKLLDKGDTWPITFSKVARLHLGNAGGVEVLVNGRSAGPLGTHGLVRDVELTPDRSQVLQ